MRVAPADPRTLALAAERAAEDMAALARELLAHPVALPRALDCIGTLTASRLRISFPERLTRVDLSYYGLAIADAYRSLLEPKMALDWGPTLALGRRLIWALLAAEEVRVAKIIGAAVVARAGEKFQHLRSEIGPDEFHLASTLEALAECAYLGGPSSLFDILGDETVSDKSPARRTPNEPAGPDFDYISRGYLAARPAYSRLPVRNPDAIDKFRKQVADEIVLCSRSPGAREAPPAIENIFRLCGLVVLGFRKGLRLRSDIIPEGAEPTVRLVSHLFV